MIRPVACASSCAERRSPRDGARPRRRLHDGGCPPPLWFSCRPKARGTNTWAVIGHSRFRSAGPGIALYRVGSMEDYESASRARQEDVSILIAGERDLAAVYMVGYAAECLLKALLRVRGKPFPSSGGAGHDLRALWSAAGFRLRDAGENGSAFISIWNTGLRYRTDIPSGLNRDDLVSGARSACTLVARHHRLAVTSKRRKARRGR
jgi:hypothetical protein